MTLQQRPLTRGSGACGVAGACGSTSYTLSVLPQQALKAFLEAGHLRPGRAGTEAGAARMSARHGSGGAAGARHRRSHGTAAILRHAVLLLRPAPRASSLGVAAHGRACQRAGLALEPQVAQRYRPHGTAARRLVLRLVPARFRGQEAPCEGLMAALIARTLITHCSSRAAARQQLRQPAAGTRSQAGQAGRRRVRRHGAGAGGAGGRRRWRRGGAAVRPPRRHSLPPCAQLALQLVDGGGHGLARLAQLRHLAARA